MNIYKYFLPILATTLVVGTSVPALSHPFKPRQILRVGQLVTRVGKPVTRVWQPVTQWFQKNDDFVELVAKENTKTILKNIGKQSLQDTIPAPISPPQSINSANFSSNGQTQDNVRQNIDRGGAAVGSAIAAGGAGYSHVSSNNNNNSNNNNKQNNERSLKSIVAIPISLIMYFF
ncbi:hypothetical protein QUA00_10185 [Microcoleus sp. T2B6]|uniref:hypothetical protein n=1 Tax=Microcoleus sp. T2B6 TaxID=3055424 RepID=UPI002FD2BBB4